MGMHANILPAFVVTAILFLGGTFPQPAADPPYASFQSSHHSLLESVQVSSWLLRQPRSTLTVSLNEEDEDGKDDGQDGKDGKDEEDGALKDLWDSVQLG
ncbi:MAG: hypothetical protein V2B18_10675 [Pseudomonadota bacterium]